MESPKFYSYVATPIGNDGDTFQCMMTNDIRGAINSYRSAIANSNSNQAEVGFHHIFSEDDSNTSKSSNGSCSSSSINSTSAANHSEKKRGSYEMMLSQLKKNDCVYVWSWRCFIDPGRLEFAIYDVMNYIRQIVEKGAFFVFVNEKIVSTNAERLTLFTLIASNQYYLDLADSKQTRCSCVDSKSSGSSNSKKS